MPDIQRLQATGSIQVTIPAHVAFDIEELFKVQRSVFERLGHPSCYSGADIRQRPPTLLSYPDAGHGLDTLVPYEPGNGAALNAPLVNAKTGNILNPAGATPKANALALAKVWPHVLTFLRKS